MKIEIWSDFACPFCYIGEKRLMKALEELNLEDQVDIEFKSFQLDVNAKSHPDKDIHQLIAEKYNISYAQAKNSNADIVQMAKEIGLDYDFDQLKPGNTRLAHEAHKFASKNGKDLEYAQWAFSSYFEKGKSLSDLDTLQKLISVIGLEPEEFMKSIEAGQYTPAVENDQSKAQELGINSVPTFIIDGKYAITGAQNVNYFKMAIEQIRSGN